MKKLGGNRSIKKIKKKGTDVCPRTNGTEHINKNKYIKKKLVVMIVMS